MIPQVQSKSYVRVLNDDDPRTTASEDLLMREVGRILVKHFPKWAWRVEIPPGQNILIIRNLTLDPRQRYAAVKHIDKLDRARMDREITFAAREYLERYERLKNHPGRFDPEDVEDRIMHFEKPEM